MTLLPVKRIAGRTPIFMVYDLRVVRAAPPLTPGHQGGMDEDDPVYLVDRRLLARATATLRQVAPKLPPKFNAESLCEHLDAILTDEPYEQSFDPNGGLVGERCCINERAFDGLIALLCEEVEP